MFNYIEIFTVALIPGFLLLDFIWQARRFKKTRHWRLRALLVSTAIIIFAGEITLLWAEWLGDYHLIDGSGLGIWGGALIGILVYELFHYGYHRLAHRWNGLWLAGHQLHHSAESLDAFGANYIHPLDAFIFTTIASLVFFPLLGLVPEAGLLGALFLTFNAMFQHSNINTPRWLGYIIQRPESHLIHHAKGIHRYNYADLPLWDMIFGTFRNPGTEELPQETGFYTGASSRLLDMMLYRNVSKPPAKKADNQTDVEIPAMVNET